MAPPLLKFVTAHGPLSFQPAATPDGPVTLQYRGGAPQTGQTWEEVRVDGLEDWLIAFLAAHPPATPVPPEVPPSGLIVATESVDYVAQVKAALEAQGVSLAGPDGAFEITANVAYGLRLVGYGLLEKTSGNMSQGYATDVIVCPNRVDLVDILGDSGGQNTPSWHVKPNEVTSDRWRTPIPPPHPV
jgi:hypothetical protein